MNDIIEALYREHSNIETLVRVLERELNVFDRGDRPDYEVVLAVIEYFTDYPDACHHPKEDMILAKLRMRDPAVAAAIGDLAAEHRGGAQRLRRVAEAVRNVLADQELLRSTVDDIIRDFVDHERPHMAMEERVFFPAADNTLQSQDWTDLASQLTKRGDPFYRLEFEERFNLLHRKILQMEEETALERSKS
jgi:hemerythrin-like domain-containing protein